MTDYELVIVGLITLLVFAAVVSALGCAAAYRNGVTDGYGYAKEPNCPGYAMAGEYLRRVMAHRWPELRPQPKGKLIPPQGGTGIIRLRPVLCKGCDRCECEKCAG